MFNQVRVRRALHDRHAPAPPPLAAGGVGGVGRPRDGGGGGGEGQSGRAAPGVKNAEAILCGFLESIKDVYFIFSSVRSPRGSTHSGRRSAAAAAAAAAAGGGGGGAARQFIGNGGIGRDIFFSRNSRSFCTLLHYRRTCVHAGVPLSSPLASFPDIDADDTDDEIYSRRSSVVTGGGGRNSAGEVLAAGLLAEEEAAAAAAEAAAAAMGMGEDLVLF